MAGIYIYYQSGLLLGIEHKPDAEAPPGFGAMSLPSTKRSRCAMVNATLSRLHLVSVARLCDAVHSKIPMAKLRHIETSAEATMRSSAAGHSGQGSLRYPRAYKYIYGADPHGTPRCRVMRAVRLVATMFVRYRTQ
jgi:hypothetical protein